METLYFIFGICASILLAIFGFLTMPFTQDHIWNEKLTIALETSAGTFTGSRVYEANTRINFFDYPSLHRPSYGVKGESIIIEIPGKGAVIARLSGKFHDCPIRKKFNMACLAQEVFKTESATSNSALAAHIQEQKGKPQNLQPELYPDFVYLPDTKQLKDLQLVAANELESVLGAGARIKEVTLTVTDEPVSTPEINARLPWFRKVKLFGTDQQKLCNAQGKCEAFRLFDFNNPIGHLTDDHL